VFVCASVGLVFVFMAVAVEVADETSVAVVKGVLVDVDEGRTVVEGRIDVAVDEGETGVLVSVAV